MRNDVIIDWLLSGDVAIQYLTCRDLLGEVRGDLQSRIATEGWGRAFLAQQRPNGHWGRGFYQTKWISTHYSLLDLMHLGIDRDIPSCRDIVKTIVEEQKGTDGGINPAGTIKESDVCINGMFLNYGTYFRVPEQLLHSVVDFILGQQLPDGGFNCRFNRSGAKHSSLHSTISILEGIAAYEGHGYTYRLSALKNAAQSSLEFILIHQLFISDRTGEIIHPAFLKFPFPSRWKYDVLRALDCFQAAKTPYDHRMQPALDHLLAKRGKDNRWKLSAKHPGKVHFAMEQAGKPSRWNTLRALRVLKAYAPEVVKRST